MLQWATVSHERVSSLLRRLRFESIPVCIVSSCPHPVICDDMTPELSQFPFYPVWSFHLLPGDSLVQMRQKPGIFLYSRIKIYDSNRLNSEAQEKSTNFKLWKLGQNSSVKETRWLWWRQCWFWHLTLWL